MAAPGIGDQVLLSEGGKRTLGQIKTIGTTITKEKRLIRII